MATSSSRLPSLRTITLTLLAMIAFSGNAVLCRLALVHDTIDPATFTLVRVGSGAVMLWLILAAAGKGATVRGSWLAAFAMFASAAAFSFAYISLSAGAGALLLFSSVQVTMVATGIMRGERLSALQWAGLVLSMLGLAALVAPGVAAPSLVGACLMLGAGVAWGAYSLLGRGITDPLQASAGNFLRAVPMALVIVALAASFVGVKADATGILQALLSGALASELGCTIWCAALPGLSPAQGVSVQLIVPVITAVAGAAMIGEIITIRLLLSAAAILGGIALVIAHRSHRAWR